MKNRKSLSQSTEPGNPERRQGGVSSELGTARSGSTTKRGGDQKRDVLYKITLSTWGARGRLKKKKKSAGELEGRLKEIAPPFLQ